MIEHQKAFGAQAAYGLDLDEAFVCSISRNHVLFVKIGMFEKVKKRHPWSDLEGG